MQLATGIVAWIVACLLLECLQQGWPVVLLGLVTCNFLRGLLPVIFPVVAQKGRYCQKLWFSRQGWLVKLVLLASGLISNGLTSFIFPVAQLSVAAVSMLLASRRPIQPQTVIETLGVRDVGGMGGAA